MSSIWMCIIERFTRWVKWIFRPSSIITYNYPSFIQRGMIIQMNDGKWYRVKKIVSRTQLLVREAKDNG